MNLGNNNVNVDDEESAPIPTPKEAGYAGANEPKSATEDYQASEHRSSLELKKTLTPHSPPLHLGGARASVPVAAPSLIDKNNALIVCAESPVSPATASIPLHSPSMTSSPRSAELNLASSEVSVYYEICVCPDFYNNLRPFSRRLFHYCRKRVWQN
jgi:hypothetical protein